MANPATNFTQERPGGFTRVVPTGSDDLSMEGVMQSLGLQAKPSGLFAVSAQVAASCVASLLWKDLAYRQEIMSLEKAREYGEAFVEQYKLEGATFYTNGNWDKYHQQSSFGYTPLTDATFSAVVMVVHPKFAACLVVEDED